MICNLSSGTLNPTMPCYSNKRGHCRVCWWISLCIVCCSLQMGQQFDQKNIRRRVYDALNVLMAMNIISKEKKEIRWIGLPTNTAQECQGLEVCTWLLGGLVSCCHCSTSAVTMLQTYFVYHRCLLHSTMKIGKMALLVSHSSKFYPLIGNWCTEFKSDIRFLTGFKI